MAKAHRSFMPLQLAILTVSDSRSRATDSSGDLLQQLAEQAGHRVLERALLPNNRYALRAQISQWIVSPAVQVVLVNGGTGFAANNCTVEALMPLFDQAIDGFGELFRQLSFQSIGSASLQSRACAGLANQTLMFAMPGSGSACELAWQQLIAPQLNAETGPCNFVPHLKSSTASSWATAPGCEGVA
ncbi:molybdenum cofactor biosynthesis protein B [Alkalimonas amylolytica]|uniref:Molybdenum cofactor biosynthesis protein B n=1 Tax=Alkalimonas amylolytica TaxID=152573 RepID=A0A1H3ZN49_ALKAM|nr:molybdenum cofactor biosynthesis protein B [Alkalimonas amylolytica]SEA25226.1 molybdenum cofactor biosynthesis protein B [Alkalimonas amylolytica]